MPREQFEVGDEPYLLWWGTDLRRRLPKVVQGRVTAVFGDAWYHVLVPELDTPRRWGAGALYTSKLEAEAALAQELARPRPAEESR